MFSIHFRKLEIVSQRMSTYLQSTTYMVGIKVASVIHLGVIVQKPNQEFKTMSLNNVPNHFQKLENKPTYGIVTIPTSMVGSQFSALHRIGVTLRKFHNYLCVSVLLCIVNLKLPAGALYDPASWKERDLCSILKFKILIPHVSWCASHSGLLYR